MSSTTSKGQQQRNERTLNDLRLNVEGNNLCADCNSPQPRWASWNLGIFLCVRCATIHRSMGSHISKVKSLTLDTWTKEQVDSMKRQGNLRSNAIYNPDPKANPPPLDIENEERDSQLQRFIVKKYKNKAFMANPPRRQRSPSPAARTDRPSSSSRLAPSSTATRRATVSLPQMQHRPVFGEEMQASAAFTPRSPAVSASYSVDLADPSARSRQAQAQPPPHPTIARAMTAPIPQPHDDSHASTPSPSNPHNPFNRNITSSANEIQGSMQSALPSQQTGSGNPFTARQQTYPSYSATSLSVPGNDYQQQQQQYQYLPHQQSYFAQPGLSPQTYMSHQHSQQQYPSFTSASQYQSPVNELQTNPFQRQNSFSGGTPQGGVWDDLAGLSISSPSHSLTPASSYPSTPSTNPFLRSSSTGILPPSLAVSPGRFQPTSDFGKALAAQNGSTLPAFTNPPSLQPSVPVQYQASNPYLQ